MEVFPIPLLTSLPPLDIDAFTIPLTSLLPQHMDVLPCHIYFHYLFMLMIDFQFTTISDSAKSEIDISAAYMDLPLDHLISPPSSPEYICGAGSSVQDTDDDKVLSHCMPSPLVDSYVDEDEDTPVKLSSHAIQPIPYSVHLMLLSHIHSAFPGCTPSTLATFQQMPQVR